MDYLLKVKVGSFGWVLFELKKGNTVRRQSWPWRHYLKLNQSTGVIYDCYFNDIKYVESDVYKPTAKDLIANDWVLCINGFKK